jgi:hypothetical protein
MGVTGLSMEGDTIFHRDLPYDPVPLEGATVDRMVTSLATRCKENQAPGGEIDSEGLRTLAREALYAPDYYPPVSQIVVGRDGTIWLRGVLPDSGRIDWRVLDPQGEPMGRFHLRAAFRIFVAEEDAVWGVQRDPSGVEYVRKFRILHEPGEDGAPEVAQMRLGGSVRHSPV